MRFLSEGSDVVRKFMERGMHLTPGALQIMLDTSESDVREVLSDLSEREDRPSIVTDEMVNQILSSEETIPSTAPKPSAGNEPDVSDERASGGDLAEVSGAEGGEGEIVESKSFGEEHEEEKIKVLKDISGKSTSEGKIEDFVQLFRDRYQKLSSIIRSREGFQKYTKLENIPRHEGEMVNLVGLVSDKRETRKKDAWLIELEDPTGRAVVYVKDSERNERVIENVKKVVTDEVIGVKAKVPGELRSGNRNPLVWGNEVVWPDVPVPRSISRSQERPEDVSGYAVLISDLHVGSSMFLSEVFEKFLEWINGKAGNEEQRKMAERVKYLIIAGDLVDGIGVYPGQQEELDIEDVRKQYERVAELLSQVPSYIRIIVAPGNHDAVRLAEPQPSLSSEVVDPLSRLNVKMVGNPAFLVIEGVKFLIYHGMGFDDLISSDPNLGRENIAPCMREVLRRRHLAPIYGEPMGGRTPIAPEREDYLVIDEVPDVLHCGHLHRYSCDEYRGVLMVNSATFQEQTVFMKRQGIIPTPGHVPLVDLKTKEAKAINFA